MLLGHETEGEPRGVMEKDAWLRSGKDSLTTLLTVRGTVYLWRWPDQLSKQLSKMQREVLFLLSRKLNYIHLKFY